MFYLENYVCNGENVYIIFSPNHEMVLPAFEYIKDQYDKANSFDNRMKKITNAICHYLNFCRLYEIDIQSKLTHDTLNEFIRYLSNIPKRMFQRLDRHPSEVLTLPVHPYITKNEVLIKKIYKEWYKELLKDGNGEFSVFYNAENIKFDEDKLLWTYNFSYIKTVLNVVLEYLYWLSKSDKWNANYSEVDSKVANRFIKLNEYSKEYYISWDIEGRIKKITGLSNQSISNRRKRRVFYESELKRFLNNEMIQKYSQRKLFFLILLLSGCRQSEALNLLIKNVRITLDKYNPFGSKTIIHWEDMFDDATNNRDVDILINSYLELNIRIAKRNTYESNRRKNKSKKPRITPLRDLFDLPSLLSLEVDNIFLDKADFLKEFEKEIYLYKKESNPYDLVRDIMIYHAHQEKAGIKIDDIRYDRSFKYMVMKIRRLFDNCWFGNLIRRYLIERELLIRKNKMMNIIHKDYLFVNMKINKGFPIEPETINTSWFKKICEDVNPRIIRSIYEPNKVLKHSMKNDLTVHSFRHTYISSRICIETANGRYNDALLKHEVGHVPTSTVAETVYFFSDSEKINEARSKLYKMFKENIDDLVFLEKNPD